MNGKYCIIGGFILVIFPGVNSGYSVREIRLNSLHWKNLKFSGVTDCRQHFRKIAGMEKNFSLLLGDLNSLYYAG